MTLETVVDWLAARGHTSYRNRIAELVARGAPPEEIDEVKREAWDRYDDWVSDPLP